jgi:tetratricopeptide (TPR) repeat protein
LITHCVFQEESPGHSQEAFPPPESPERIEVHRRIDSEGGIEKMRKSTAIVAIVVVSLFAIYGCKSVETTSAVLHNEHGQYDKAIEMSKKALEKNPKDAEAHFQLGVSYSYTGDMANAYTEFKTAAKLNPSKAADCETDIKSNWAKHFNNGLSEVQAENLAGGAHEFELTTQADPRQVKGWLNLAKVYYSLAQNDTTYLPKAYETVDTLLAKTTDKDESYANVLTLSGAIMVKRGMSDDAQKIFEKLLLVDPATFEDVERAANTYLAKRDWATGATFLQMAMDARKKANAEDFESYYNLGAVYFNGKNCPKAIEMYLAALELDQENKQGNYGILLAYYSCEMYDDAVLQGQKYTEKNADDPNGWRILSLAYSKKGMKLKAEEAAKKFQELSQ